MYPFPRRTIQPADGHQPSTGRLLLAVCLLLVMGLELAGVARAAAPGATPARQGGASVSATVSTAVVPYRTVVAHELAKPISGGEDYLPRLSGDGSRIVFATYDRANAHEYLFLANFDGSNVQQLADEVNGTITYGDIQISDDGQRVVMVISGRVWVFDSGGAPFSYTPFSEAINLYGFTLAGNGGQIYFVVPYDRPLYPSGLAERGVYRMNVDGTGLQRIISPEMLALATGEDISAFAAIDVGGMSALSVSQDGSRLALGLFNSDRSAAWLMAYDGQLRLLTPKGRFADILLSADGSTVVANGNWTDTTVYVMTWAGVDVRSVPGEANCSNALQVTGTGSGFLVDCQGSPMIGIATGARELYFGRGSADVPVNALMAGGMVNASMSRGGTRFVFATDSPYTGNTIVSVEVDPLDQGGAPRISNPNLDPSLLLSNYGSVTALSFGVELPANTGLNIGTGVTHEGIDARTISTPSWFQAEPSGLYTSNLAATAAAPGFYTYRIVADIMTQEARRHATAVYFGPLTVDGAPPAAASIDYPTGAPGSYFTVSGSGFPPGGLVTAALNGVVISNSLLVDDTGKLVFYLNSAQAQPGKYLVSLQASAAALGRQRAGATVRFTVADGAPDHPLAGIRPVFDIPAGLALYEVYLPLVRR